MRSFHACSAIFSKILHECRARYITSVYVFRRSTLCKFNLTTAKPVWAVCIRPDCPHHARSTQQHDRVMHVHISRDHLPVFGFGRKDRRKCTLMDKFFIRVHLIIPLFFGVWRRLRSSVEAEALHSVTVARLANNDFKIAWFSLDKCNFVSLCLFDLILYVPSIIVQYKETGIFLG